MGAAGEDKVPGCKREEAAGLEMLFANARPARLWGKHYRTYFCCTNVQDISAAKTTTQSEGGGGSPLENTLFLNTFEKK